MDKLPFLISIPHGGDRIPDEVADRVCLSAKDLFEDSDAFTRTIYGIAGDVLALVDTEIARAIVDLNRHIDDRPPDNPDGIVKTRTCHSQPVYSDDRFPEPDLANVLIEKYYRPYHNRVRASLENQPDIRLALDCHTMEASGPSISPDRGKDRPMICLGNVHGKTCPDEWVNKLAQSFRESFGFAEDEVKINQPFAGGYITRTYGTGPVPWVQIEMNRILYLAEPWYNSRELSVDPTRLDELRKMFRETLVRFQESL